MKRIVISVLTCSLLISAALSVTLISREAYAQAYCALRQPHRAQQKLFPKSTTLETFTNQVTEQHRSQVQSELKFTIHHDELGLHTLYAVFLGEGATRQHLGYIHVRSEQGEGGLIEIAWALYPDLTVKGFIFQRCREMARRDVEADIFKMFLHKRSGKMLSIFLNKEGDKLVNPLPMLNEEAQPLGLTLLRSALKTIAVTRAVWPKVTSP